MSILCKKMVFMPIASLLLIQAGAFAQNIWHVAASSCSNDESTCGTAQSPCCTIQDAIDKSADGDTVLVRPGTYTQTIDFYDNQGVGRGVTVKKDVAFAGEAVLQWPSTTHPVVDFNCVTITCGDDHGTLGGITEEGVAEGFTITGKGVGIDVHTANPSIKGNMVGGCGGPGITLTNSSATIEENTICNNTAGLDGGGISFYGSQGNDLKITACKIERNIAFGPLNYLQGGGGGIYLNGSGSVTISRCVIRENQAARQGGGIFTKDIGASMTADTSTLTVTVEDSLIINNSAITQDFADGGGITFGLETDSSVINCTISNNYARNKGGAIYYVGAGAKSITSSILWDNTSGTSGSYAEIVNDSGVAESVTFSDIEGGHTGEGNIDDDPLFCAASVYNYHLRGNSLCIDAGDNSVASSADLDDNTRVVDGPDAGSVATADMGCYEYPHDSNLGCTRPGVPKACPDCESATIVYSFPSNGKRDARQPHPSNNNSMSSRQGIGSPNSYTGGPEPITIELDITGAASPDCWSICETDIEAMEGGYLDVNYIASIDEVDWGVYEILLNRPISAGNWTTISYFAADEYVAYASLPADVNVSNQANSADIISWWDCCYNSTCSGYGTYRCDVNHSGGVNTGDYLTLIDLLNGYGTFVPWSGVYLATNTCPADSLDSAVSDDSGDSDENAVFASWIVDYLTTVTPDSPARLEDHQVIVGGMIQWCLDHFSAQERADLVTALSGPDLSFASAAGADAAAGVIEALSK